MPKLIIMSKTFFVIGMRFIYTPKTIVQEENFSRIFIFSFYNMTGDRLSLSVPGHSDCNEVSSIEFYKKCANVEKKILCDIELGGN